MQGYLWLICFFISLTAPIWMALSVLALVYLYLTQKGN